MSVFMKFWGGRGEWEGVAREATRTDLDLVPGLLVSVERAEVVLDRNDATVTLDELLVLEEAQEGAGAECDDGRFRGLAFVSKAGAATDVESS